MSMFRRKPEVVEAIRCERGTASFDALAALLPDRVFRDLTTEPHRFLVATLAGVVVADYGDWIVKVANGNCFPMSDAKFRRLYEPVEE